MAIKPPNIPHNTIFYAHKDINLIKNTKSESKTNIIPYLGLNSSLNFVSELTITVGEST
jgi:hypothetical protein